ncbi:T-cell surface glycoprotein CD4 [Sigmodon hispidus]
MYQGISLRQFLLVLQLAQLPAVTQGKTVKVAREGTLVELPCVGSQQKNPSFVWKRSDQKRVLTNLNNLVIRGHFDMFNRFDSRSTLWDRGLFPLIINKVQLEDSDTYICEVDNQRTEVELWVFRVTARPDYHLLQGQTLTLTLDCSPKVTNPSIQCTSPKSRLIKGSKTLSVPNIKTQDSGTWTCTVTQNQEKEKFDINISVLGFQETAPTVYRKEGEPLEVSFPLNFGDEKMQGELKWRAEKVPSPEILITFLLENKKVSLLKTKNSLKLQLSEALPLHLKIPQVSLENAGSGNLTLSLTKGTLRQEVNLVVMKLVQKNNTLTCEVRGPTSPKMRLTLRPENQRSRVSKQEKVVEVLAPESGLWQCLLTEGDEVKINSNLQVLSRGWDKDQPMFLAAVLGGIFSFLVFAGFCILCCVKCRHQQRQAERMTHIKRLLSEKKTCQCPHRMQKTQNLI